MALSLGFETQLCFLELDLSDMGLYKTLQPPKNIGKQWRMGSKFCSEPFGENYHLLTGFSEFI